MIGLDMKKIQATAFEILDVTEKKIILEYGSIEKAKEEFNKFQNDCLVIGDKIGKFMNYLNTSNFKGKKFTKPNPQPEIKNSQPETAPNSK
jgi:hypothetical protein